MSSKKEVINWEEQLAAEAQEVAKTERAAVSKIGLKGGIMTYMGQAVEGNTLDVIVTASCQERVYYDKPYDPDVISDPACFALALPGNQLFPHENVPNPVNKSCNGCKFDEFKSARNGKGKACSERRRLAVIPVCGSPEEILEAEVAVISLPVMSVRNWSIYVNELSARAQRPAWGVITQVKVVPDAKSQFKVQFEYQAKLGDDFLAAVHNRRDTATNLIMSPYEMSGGGAIDNNDGTEEEDAKY